METTKLKRFAQYARTALMGTVKTKLDSVLSDDSSAKREYPEAVEKLVAEIEKTSEEQVVEKVAYIWFNRFIALRFMDVNRYTKLNIVSPEPGQFQPSILADAKMGHIDDALVSESVREKVLSLLENRTPSPDPQGEVYKLLVVAACNYYSYAMPFLFERIADYTELLMPDDLLSGDSILSYVRETMTPDVCKDVEVIGWLYQFYISEKKDLVFEGLKKNKKVMPENIPAATQLFTPHWIVQYMVENSLGRLWVLNNPNSKLIQEDSKFKMEYYIKPETPEEDYLKISSPTELKICDPACGSGHILVYAFDLLFEIYKEAGYTDDDSIVENILKHNLYGIEIDERAAELAAFALAMKAASYSGSKRRFFRNPIEANICKLEAIKFSDEEIEDYVDAVGRDLFTADLQKTLKDFEEADNFGSLIQPAVKDVTSVLEILKAKDVSHDLFLLPIHKKVIQILEQADYLSQKYHVVVANPPYMGSKGMNFNLQEFLKYKYPDSCDDLMTAFMEQSLNLIKINGYVGMINIPSWMFNPSYTALRKKLLSQITFIGLNHNGRGIFGADFGSVTFIIKNSEELKFLGYYKRLFEKHVDVESQEIKKERFLNKKYKVYSANQKEFLKIEGAPFAYWISQKLKNILINKEKLRVYAKAAQGIKTGDNEQFLRLWFEVDYENSLSEENKNRKWFACTKGGDFRRWYGNYEYVLNWQNDGYEIRNFFSTDGRLRSRPQNIQYFFLPGTTWSTVSSGSFSMRLFPKGMCFESAGSVCSFYDEKNIMNGLLLMNTKVVSEILNILSPGIGFREGAIAKLPIVFAGKYAIGETIIEISRKDWDSYENSWEFKKHPLIFNKNKIEDEYIKLYSFREKQVKKLKKFEEENNKIFIEAYGLEDELSPEVPLKEITLTCNPYYRYDAKKSKEELDALQLADTMKEYISYAVGVMLGRYSLDHEGLYIADADVSLKEANAKLNITTPTFEADDDNVIPVLDGDWFTDDITERFLQFVKVTFGEEHYEENIKFIEEAIGKSIRKYFVKDFYADHVKRYKKRPIYWMFSSPKGSFQALIYMHRYKSDTVSVILNDYLREFITKLEATKENLEAIDIKADASKSEKTKALKEIEKIKKMIIELEEYEREILYPLATKKRKIDLDNGVKHNYPLFGNALKKVAGLS